MELVGVWVVGGVWTIHAEFPDMKRIVAGLAVLALAGACGTTTSERGLSGAALGAGFGAIGGGVGVLAGALIGGGIGVLTDADTINLGKPIWD